MDNIWFYDFSFRPLMIIHDMTSVNWQLYFNDIGSFELHTTVQDKITSMLRSHPYMVAVQGDKQAIITGWQLGKECILYGRTCNWLLTRRITPAFETKTGTVQDMTQTMVLDAFADVSELTIGTSIENDGEIQYTLRSDQTTFDAVQACLEQGDMGHKVLFDVIDGRWKYCVLTGRELQLVLSENRRNASESVYSEDILNCYSGGWYQQEQEGDGADSVRTYLAGDDKTGIYRWECMLESGSAEEAGKELEKKVRNKEVTAIMRGVHFGEDYDLGDFVYVQVDKGGFQLTEKKRVTGVHIWYEADTIGEEPILSTCVL
ncbi:MAG: hypothetical protein E7393_04825 [Ruminococcaceae bacterium]|nr:hypothetical protein [Oscillospiraceae bacterium]